MKIFVVVLNWRDAPSTERCARALLSGQTPPTEVVIIDNDSGDGSFDALQGLGPDVTLIQSGRNLGYGGGNNVGIRYALEHGADWIWVLNNDTVVSSECLAELLKVVSPSSSGVFVPTIRMGDEPSVVWYAGGDLDVWRCLTHHRGWMSSETPRVASGDKPVTFATGCSLFASRDVFERIGLFSDSFFMYWEDVDFSFRLTSNGFTISYVPAAVVWHAVGSASGSTATVPSPFGLYYRARNRLWFARSLRRRNRLVAYVWTVPATLRGLQAATRGARGQRWPGARAVLKGVLDGLTPTPACGAPADNEGGLTVGPRAL